MSGPDTETLTAALRRLADEHASGLLSVATPGRDVVVELLEGSPVAIGPVHDVSARVGEDAPEGLTAVAVVDELVDRTVAAIVGGQGDWQWDVASESDRVPVPTGLVDELARRAVDAAQALAVLAPEDVLLPGHEVETDGELDRVRRLYDGERSMEEVAEAADLTLAAVATMTAALVAAGALAVDGDEPEEEPVSWSDAVRASEADDEDDEPELWVMEPIDDDEPEEEFDDVEDAEPARGLFFGTTPAPRTDPDPVDADLLDPEPTTHADGDALPDDEDAVAASATPPPPPPHDEPTVPAASDDQDDESPAPPPPAATPAAAQDAWNDTAWLDELSPQDDAADAPPVLAAGDEEPADAREALSSMLQDLQGDEAPATPSAAPDDPAGADENAQEADAGARTPGPGRREPKAEPGEVAEFLRELSRLALDED